MDQLVSQPSMTRSPWPTSLKIVALAAALAVCFDGFDNLLLPPSVTAIGADWHLKPSAFSIIFALSTVGYAIGSTIGGLVSDRVGRRITLIASVVLVGVASFLTSVCTGLLPLAFVRTLTGVAIGGILVSAFTAVPEFTPPRLRGIVIAAVTLCEPIGGVLAGVFSAALLVQHGWRPLFFVGGVVPIVYAVVLFFVLTETPAFLAASPSRAAKLAVLLKRLGLSASDPLAQPPEKHESGGISALLKPQYRTDSLLLWVSGFLWLLFLFMVLDWLPTLFTLAGAPPRVSIATLTCFTLGAAIGALTTIFLIRPFGTRRPLLIIGVALFIVQLLLCAGFAAHLSPALLLPLIFATGLCCASGQGFLFVLIPHVYDARLRGAGVGMALGVGRLGTIAAAFLGAFALSHHGAWFFECELVIGAIAFLCAVSVRNQVLAGSP